MSHHERVVGEFTAQAATFGASGVANAAATLDALAAFCGGAPGERWLEAASGPGLVAQGLARVVGPSGSVLGIDVTPAMVWSAGAAADKAGLGNVSFTVGDAVASGLEAASFDGAVTRFSVHHVPVPARLVAEMARVVRPGGAVVVCDHVADDDADAVAWSQEIERLRDPSHWASLPVSRLRALGAGVPGLTLEDEALADVELDYEDWLARGSGGVAARTLIDGALAAPPAAAACFGWRDGAATLGLRVWMGRWRVLGGDG